MILAKMVTDYSFTLSASIFYLLILIVSASPVKNDDNKKPGRGRPNVIFMVADDLGFNDIGFKNKDIISPNLDNLAFQGIYLNNSYMLPACSPSRATFMTGYYAFRTGMQHNVIHATIPAGLPLKFPLISDKLKELGYSTHALGKWNLGFCDWKYTPLYRGFDSFQGMYQASNYYYNHTSNVYDGVDKLGYDFQDDYDVAWRYYGIHSSIPIVNHARKIIATHDTSTPLFLYLAFQYVHVPHEVPQKYVDLYNSSTVQNVDRRVFSGMVSAMDDDVGKVIAQLKQSGLYDNSIILFTSDNGAHPYSSGNNYPLRGAKGTLYEGGTRVPAFIHSPLLENKGYVYNGLIHAVDWHATIVGMAGGKSASTDGIDMWQTIQKNLPSPRKEMVYNMDNYYGPLNAAIRVDQWKLIVGEAGGPDDWISPENVTGQFRDSLAEIYPQFLRTNSTRIQLYDIENDPTETTDLSGSRPDVVQRLQKRIQYYEKQIAHSVYSPYDPAGDPSKTQGAFRPGWCTAYLDPSYAHYNPNS